MKMPLTTVIPAGVTASAIVILFLLLVPKLLGLASIDITRQVGLIFSLSSPHLAGSIFMVLMGTLWAAIFLAFYRFIPGSPFIKGALFGLLVGVFSLTLLPSLLVSVCTFLGHADRYCAAPFLINASAIMTLLAYITFGLALSWSCRPANSQ